MPVMGNIMATSGLMPVGEFLTVRSTRLRGSNFTAIGLSEMTMLIKDSEWQPVAFCVPQHSHGPNAESDLCSAN